jgi:hypothetical protein
VVKCSFIRTYGCVAMRSKKVVLLTAMLFVGACSRQVTMGSGGVQTPWLGSLADLVAHVVSVVESEGCAVTLSAQSKEQSTLLLSHSKLSGEVRLYLHAGFLSYQWTIQYPEFTSDALRAKRLRRALEGALSGEGPWRREGA